MGNAKKDCTSALCATIETCFKPNNVPRGKNDFIWTTEPEAECSSPEDDNELINKMLQSKSAGSIFSNRASIIDLWYGNEEALAEAFPDTQNPHRTFDWSRADASLMQQLAFWTGKNCERMDRLFRMSGLYRDKWEQREDYRIATISHAVGLCTAVYKGKKNTNTVNNQIDITPPSGVQQLDTEMREGFQFMTAQQQVEYFSGCVYIQDRHRVLTLDGSLLKSEQFNAVYGGYVFSLDAMNNKTTRKAWDALTESQAVRFPKVHGTCFNPRLPPGKIIIKNGRRFANSFFPAYGERASGDPAPFLNHVKKLLPVEQDAALLLSYLAACVQYPGEKFQWCPLIQGVEGNGKSVFHYVIAYALGEQYVHVPNASDLANKFNAWILEKLLIFVEEIHTGARQELADILKPLITNRRVEIQGKGIDQTTGDNCANFFMCSNHKDAVLKTRNDRRYCIFFTAQQEPADLERDGLTATYFDSLYKWLEHGGNAIVANFLSTYPTDLSVMMGRAPTTSSTAAAIAENLGVAEQLLLEAIDIKEFGFRCDLICTKAASDYLRLRGKNLSPQKIAQVLGNIDFIRHPALAAGDGKISINNVLRRIYVRAGSLSAQLNADGIRQTWTRANAVNIPTFQSSSNFLEG